MKIREQGFLKEGVTWETMPRRSVRARKKRSSAASTSAAVARAPGWREEEDCQSSGIPVLDTPCCQRGGRSGRAPHRPRWLSPGRQGWREEWACQSSGIPASGAPCCQRGGRSGRAPCRHRRLSLGRQGWREEWACQLSGIPVSCAQCCQKGGRSSRAPRRPRWLSVGARGGKGVGLSIIRDSSAGRSMLPERRKKWSSAA
jgi:hypothetical protein